MSRWHDLVPKHIADRQVAWERAHRVARAYRAGVATKFIAEKLGISVARVWQLIAYKRELGMSPPVEIWLNRGGEVAELYRKLSIMAWRKSRPKA